MINSIHAAQDVIDDLQKKLAGMHQVSTGQILIFPDFIDFLQGTLSFHDNLENHKLLGAGYLTPDVAIAADRAHLEFKEILGASPFAGDTYNLLYEIESGRETVYLANPNRITGANFSLQDLELIAQRIPEGLMIVDEKLFEFYGISGVTLIEKYPQIMIIRSLTASYGIASDETGYVLGNTARIERLREALASHKLTRTHCRLMGTSLTNREALKNRLEMVHDEALSVAMELNKLKVQNRITAGDFLLLRVAEPVMVGNYLAQHKVKVENLDGYPELKQYLRYPIQSELSNRNLISAFKKMPSKYFRLKDLDRRMITLKGKAEERSAEEEIPEKIIDRGKVDISGDERKYERIPVSK